MRKSVAVRATQTAVATRRNRFLRPPKSPIAPSTGIMRAVMIADAFTARVHQIAPWMGSGWIACA